MKSYLDRITIRPDQLDGKPCVRGLRISVQTILEFLSAGDSAEDILEQYPLLSKEDITACLQYAVKLAGKEVSYQPI